MERLENDETVFDFDGLSEFSTFMSPVSFGLLYRFTVSRFVICPNITGHQRSVVLWRTNIRKELTAHCHL